MQNRMWSAFAFVCCLSLVIVSSAHAQDDDTPPPTPTQAEGLEGLKKKEPAPDSTVTEDSTPSPSDESSAEGDKKEEKEEKKETAKEKKAKKEKTERTESYSSVEKAWSTGTFYWSTSFTTWQTGLVGGISGIQPIYGKGVLGQRELVHFWSPSMFANSFPQLHTGEFTKVSGQVGGGIVLYDETAVGPQCRVYSIGKPIAAFLPWNENTKAWGDPVYVFNGQADGEIVKEGNPLRSWKFIADGPGVMVVYLPAE